MLSTVVDVSQWGDVQNFELKKESIVLVVGTNLILIYLSMPLTWNTRQNRCLKFSSFFLLPKSGSSNTPYIFHFLFVHWPKVKLDHYCELQVLDLFQQELQKKQRSIPKDKLELREVDTWESRCDFYAAIYRSGQLEIIQAALEEAKSRQRVFIEDNDLQVGDEGEEGEEEEDDAEDEVVDPVVKKPRIHWAKREGKWNGQGILSCHTSEICGCPKEDSKGDWACRKQTTSIKIMMWLDAPQNQAVPVFLGGSDCRLYAEMPNMCAMSSWKKKPDTWLTVGIMEAYYAIWLVFLALVKWSIIRCKYISSTAQGGGGSFKNRKRIGEIDCCEWRMPEQKHWPTD